MIVFPNCKINLGLRILRKRIDGYHDLETIFYPLPFYDVLEIIPNTGNEMPDSGNKSDTSSILFSGTGLLIDGNVTENLCVKAWHLLKKDFPQLPEIQMHLHKAIPTGAGLGGGSADAAYTLRLLNKQFQLNLSTEQLLNYSMQLGSDCPFFIIDKPCFATGRGEIMEPVTINLSAYKLFIVNPGIHINTAKAFSGITPALPCKSVKEIIQQPVTTWKNELINDFEKNIFIDHPEIDAIKKKLYDCGALYASMTGSGSTVYGILEKDKIIKPGFPAGYFIKELIS